jgi:mannose-6-phosphate isomerase-like protein (cupin superfamily)
MGTCEVVIRPPARTHAGTFFLAKIVLEAAFPGPPRHFRERLHETIHDLESEPTMTLDDKVTALPPGACASIPPGIIHTFRNDGAHPLRELNLNARRRRGPPPARAGGRRRSGPANHRADGRDRTAPRLPPTLTHRARGSVPDGGSAPALAYRKAACGLRLSGETTKVTSESTQA